MTIYTLVSKYLKVYGTLLCSNLKALKITSNYSATTAGIKEYAD